MKLSKLCITSNLALVFTAPLARPPLGSYSLNVNIVLLLNDQLGFGRVQAYQTQASWAKHCRHFPNFLPTYLVHHFRPWGHRLLCFFAIGLYEVKRHESLANDPSMMSAGNKFLTYVTSFFETDGIQSCQVVLQWYSLPFRNLNGAFCNPLLQSPQEVVILFHFRATFDQRRYKPKGQRIVSRCQWITKIRTNPSFRNTYNTLRLKLPRSRILFASLQALKHVWLLADIQSCGGCANKALTY